MKNTNLDNCKETAKILFLAVDIKPEIFGLCSHPFTNDIYVGIYDENRKLNMVDITNKGNYEMWKEKVFKQIDECVDLSHLLMLITKPYKMTFLRYTKENISKKEFSKVFGKTWTYVENPNQDVNVSLKMAIKWFKEYDKKFLMDEEDYKIYESLEEEFVVYRGVAIGHEPKGLSYTRNYEKAKWFAERYDDYKNESKKSYILKAKIKKENVLAYFNTRGEDEIVVDSFAIWEDVEKIENK